MQNDWKNVPQDIKDTFDRLGIPEAESKSLAGVGAQYDSELVYHNVKEEVAAQGVVYTDMESAMKGEYADMVQQVLHEARDAAETINSLLCTALSGLAVRSSTFRRAFRCRFRSSRYFRLNAKGAGQFEHTLIIVDEGASLHFIEGCSAPKYNVANLHAGLRRAVSSRRTRSSAIRRLRTGRRICTTSTPKRAIWSRRAASSSGSAVRSARTSDVFTR